MRTGTGARLTMDCQSTMVGDLRKFQLSALVKRTIRRAPAQNVTLKEGTSKTREKAS
jgi:hypothetical protein